VKAIFVPMLLQNSLNLSKSNYFPLSTVKVLGTLNLQIMFCQTNFFTVFKVIVASGLASIHFLKYLIATIANLFLPAKVVEVRQDLCPSQVGGMSCTVAEGFDW
jgi:hypothetical protein